MTLKSLLVPLAGDDGDRNVLAMAGQVALAEAAHLAALYADTDPSEISLAIGGDGSGGYLSRELLSNLEQRIAERRARTIALYAAWQRTCGLPERPTADAVLSGPSARLVVSPASPTLLKERVFAADLVVAALPAAGEVERSRILETSLFDAGRPVLAVPPGFPVEVPAGPAPVVVLWRSSAESARAVTAALPFLRRAGGVTVFYKDAPDDILGYLAAHGVASGTRPIAEPISGPALLADAAALGARLLVFGAYLRSRTRAFVFGGVTRHILEHAPFPILIAH